MSAYKITVSKIERSCEDVASLLKALSHPQRLLILGHLSQGPKTVSELQKLCDISQSQLSQFLVRMKSEGLLTCQREGRFQYYAPADKRLIKLVTTLQNLFCS